MAISHGIRMSEAIDAQWSYVDLETAPSKSQVGTPLGHRMLLRHLQGACARAGIRRVSFHTLRHSAAALLLAQGVDSRVVMEILGHTSPTMMRRYQHVVDELEHGAAIAMDAALRPRTPSGTPSGGLAEEPTEMGI